MSERSFEGFIEELCAELSLDLEPRQVTTTTEFGDAGVDSLALAEAMALFAERGIELPTALIGELRTFGDLHHYYCVGLVNG